MLRVFPGKRCVKLRYPAPGGYVSASTALLSCSKVTIDEGDSPLEVRSRRYCRKTTTLQGSDTKPITL